MSRHLYTVPPPVSMQGSLLLHDSFFVPNTSEGMKCASWLEDATLAQREELFKTAVEQDTRDLAAAYNALCSGGVTPKAEDTAGAADAEEDSGEDDYGQDSFTEPD